MSRRVGSVSSSKSQQYILWVRPWVRRTYEFAQDAPGAENRNMHPSWQEDMKHILGLVKGTQAE